MHLIDLDELKKFPIRADNYDKKHGNENFVMGIEAVLEYAENLPTVDAEPVRHGRWVNGECTNCKHNLIELCSGEDYELDMYAEFDAEFCPFCGARMDGGAENDT